MEESLSLSGGSPIVILGEGFLRRIGRNRSHEIKGILLLLLCPPDLRQTLGPREPDT